MNTMMHRCSGSSSSDAHGYGRPCSCGFFHSQNSPFSVIFSQKSCNNIEGDHHMYWPTPPPPVDCTLSLGTPSTRYISSCDDAEKRRSSCLSNFRCDLFHTTGGAQNLNQSPYMMSSRGGANHGNANFGVGGGGGGGGGGETMLTRRCANCDTTSTPLWRNGPKGPKSLCNACGIRYKKEERRATAAATTTTNTTGGGAIGVDAHHHHTLNTSWVHHHSQNQKPSCITSTYGNEFRFIQDADVDRDSDTATATAAGAVFPFLSWRLSVTDSRPGLVHNLTM